jgi:hypothetical protein
LPRKSKRLEDSKGEEMAEDTEDIRSIMHTVIQEFVKAEQNKADPAHKAELLEERRRRESLEQRVNELVAENERSRAKAEEAERCAAVRAELQRLGVAKIELAYKAVKDDIRRGDDGRLTAADGSDARDYLAKFVSENPELLPARLGGGSGAIAGQRVAGSGSVEMESIRPGMSPEDRERVRREIAKVASQTLRGV